MAAENWTMGLQGTCLTLTLKAPDRFCSAGVSSKFKCLFAGSIQGCAASAFRPHHRFLRPFPRSRTGAGILPGPGPRPPLHRSPDPVAARHLRPAPPGHADSHRPLQSHLQEGTRKTVRLSRSWSLLFTQRSVFKTQYYQVKLREEPPGPSAPSEKA